MLYTTAELEFLRDNRALYEAFATEAIKVRSTGRQHYSARTIAEVLRHNAAVSGADTKYKINNNCVPMMARIFMKVWCCQGFFEVRNHE